MSIKEQNNRLEKKNNLFSPTDHLLQSLSQNVCQKELMFILSNARASSQSENIFSTIHTSVTACTVMNLYLPYKHRELCNSTLCVRWTSLEVSLKRVTLMCVHLSQCTSHDLSQCTFSANLFAASNSAYGCFLSTTDHPSAWTVSTPAKQLSKWTSPHETMLCVFYGQS